MSGLFSEQDAVFMREALALARDGEGRVSPNPPVGCVLARNGAVVGRGWHNRLGDLHAEAMALRGAGAEAEGSTAYVTLGPCGTRGRQPPCADALIAAGVREVVVAAEDPNPRNASGVDVLRRAGVTVRSGLLRDEAEYLARGFFKMMRRGLPHVTLKYAMTLDGKIAAASGDSKWVSGPESRELVQDMRSRSDAVLIGSGTALADDPLLNVRDPVLARRESGCGPGGHHPQPFRVVADSRCRLSAGAAMLDPANNPGGRVIVATGGNPPPGQVDSLVMAGAEIISLPSGDGHIQLERLLRELGRCGINMVLCEGGAELAAGLLRAGLVDEVAAFVAPKLIGGRDAPGPVESLGLTLMSRAARLAVRECKLVGGDIFIRAG